MKERIVTHPIYGKGKVQLELRGGFQLQVSFESGKICIIRFDEIEEDSPSQRRDIEPIKPLSPNFKFRQMIEAFRMGIVPEKYIEDFTFGRNIEINNIQNWLKASQESSRILIGAYGTGKTHLLNYTHYHAIREGYAVAYVAMDDTETPFSNPKRVYSQLVQNLQFCSPSDSPLNFKPQNFQCLVEKSLSNNLLRDHSYFQKLMWYKEEAVWDWLKAKEKQPKPYKHDGKKYDVPGIYDYTTAANIFCYLLSGLGWATQKIGLKGLLLIFDEAESISSSRSIRMERSYNFLEALLATARSEAELLQEPKKRTEDSAYQFDFCRHANDIPFLYKQPSGLKILIAFTSDQDFINYPEISKISKLDLKSLNHDDIDQAFKKLADIYGKAYKIDSQSLPLEDIYKIIDWEDQPTRILIKSYIEAFDIMRFNPEADPWDLLQ